MFRRYSHFGLVADRCTNRRTRVRSAHLAGARPPLQVSCRRLRRTPNTRLTIYIYNYRDTGVRRKVLKAVRTSTTAE